MIHTDSHASIINFLAVSKNRYKYTNEISVVEIGSPCHIGVNAAWQNPIKQLFFNSVNIGCF